TQSAANEEERHHADVSSCPVIIALLASSGLSGAACTLVSTVSLRKRFTLAADRADCGEVFRCVFVEADPLGASGNDLGAGRAAARPGRRAATGRRAAAPRGRSSRR